MKITLAAALTAATLATPAMADDVFDCFMDKMDDQIATMTDLVQHFAQTTETIHGDAVIGHVDATYDAQTKQTMIDDCETSTGQKSNGFAEGVTRYSNGGPVTLHFKP